MAVKLLFLSVMTTLLPALISAATSCNQDNCLRAFLNNKIQAPEVCSDWFANPPISTFPAFASPCSSSVARISSACSCVATAPPVTTSTSSSSSSSSTSSTTTPTTCPTIPPASTITITSVTTASPTTCATASASSTPPACSCTNLLSNPSFENSTPSPWRIIADDPNSHWSISPGEDIPSTGPSGAYDGEWALEFTWSATPATQGSVGIYQSVPLPSCCFNGQELALTWAVFNEDNECFVSVYLNVITPSSPSGQITGEPSFSYVLSPSNAWQPNGVAFTYGGPQDDFQVEMLFLCENTSPVWIDLVQVNPLTAP